MEDRFHLGSISKPVTATVLANIVEEGRLSWDSTPPDVFPEFAAATHPALRGIRLEHPLSHRAGLAPFVDDEEIAHLPPFDGLPRDQRLAFTEWLLRREPSAPPGSDHLYSNAGYAVVAAMAERVTDRLWVSLVRERLFEPLHLASAGFGWPAMERRDQPWGHRKTEQGFVPHPPDDAYQLGPLLAPAGDVHTNILDLVRFGRVHLLGLAGEDILLRADTVRTLHTPLGDYGLGWHVDDGGHQHSGSAGTFLAVLLLRPRHDRVYAVAANASIPDQSEGGEDTELITEIVGSLVQRFEGGRR